MKNAQLIIDNIKTLAKKHGWCCLVIIILAGLLMSKGLFSTEWLASDYGKDVQTYFYYTYGMAQEGFARGEIISWNPYIYGGTPVVGAFQYALLYPPHWIASLLPVSLSINWMIFGHICLAGLGMYAWTHFRGLRPVAACLAGVVFMLSGPFFSRITVGHTVTVYTMAWIPLVFLGIDGWVRHRRWRWVVLAALAAAAQMYTSLPQCFYNTAMLAGLYALFELWFVRQKLKTAIGLIAIYPLAALLAAAELLPGILLSTESTRAGGISLEYAAPGSIGPEQLWLVLFPRLFGGFGDMAWWGNHFIYEIIAYCGLGGLLLAIIGWLGFGAGRKIQFAVLLAFVLMIAMGPHTPLFGLMRQFVPLFSSFRVMGRIDILLALLIALLAGHGFDRLLQGVKVRPVLPLTVAFVGLLALTTGLALRAGFLTAPFQAWVQKIIVAPGYVRAVDFGNPQWWQAAQSCSAYALYSSGILMLLLGGLFFIKNHLWRSRLVWLMVVADLMIFAWPQARFFPTATVEYPGIAQFLKGHPGDYRNLNLINKDSNILMKAEGIWGLDPVLLKRYGEFMAFSQGINPDKATIDIPVVQNSYLFKLLRGRYAFVPTQQGIQVALLHEDVLPRFLVVSDYRVMTNRDEILAALNNPNFNFRQQVILETDPGLPHPTLAAEPLFLTSILSSSNSRWEVEVTTFAPGVLLMTDSYAKGWHAKALPGSVQQQYDLLPANYAVRGIPLTVAGKHLLEIKYIPPGFALGLWISVLTLLALAGAGAFIWWRGRGAVNLAENPATC